MSTLVALDDAVRAGTLDVRTPFLDGLFGTATHVGDTWAIIVLSIVLVYVVARSGRGPQARAIAFAVVVGALPLVQGLKAVVGRVRPPVADALIAQPVSASWPSGHAFAALLVALLASWVLSTSGVGARWARIAIQLATVAAALLVGASRVYLGVHWATDVIAGWVLALAWAVVIVLVSRYRARRSKMASTGA